MKIPIVLIYLLLCLTFQISSAQISCGTEAGNAKSGITPCTSDFDIDIDFGNQFFIPDENSGVLEVKVNIWIVTHQFYWDGSNTTPVHFTNDSNHSDYLNQQNYLKTLPGLANQRVYANANKPETCIGGIETNAPSSIDSKIRLVLNEKQNGEDAIYYIHDFLGAGGSNLSNVYDTYINGQQDFDNAINFLFIYDKDGASGWVAQNDINRTFIVINRGYQRYQNGQGIIEGQNFAHEFNHVLGLLHTHQQSQRDLFEYECIYECDGLDFNSGLNHNMACRGSNQIYLSPLQVGHIRRVLTTSYRSQFLKDPVSSTHEMVINEDVTIETNEVVYWSGDIIVDYPGILEIKGDLIMAYNSRILVRRGAKLIVDGGLITSCGEEVNWSGIRVEGGDPNILENQIGSPDLPNNPNFSGVVWLKNEAILERAELGITTNNKHLGWPEVKDAWGGLIWVESNSTIRACRKAVEIMKFGNQTRKDKSRFISANIENCLNGISVWRSDGVRIEKSNFIGNERTGIVPYNAQVIIENGNYFEENRCAVDLTNSAINPFSMKIGNLNTDKNTFFRNNTSIKTYNMLNTQQSFIENNELLNQGSNFPGILCFGRSWYGLNNNTMNSHARSLWLNYSGGPQIVDLDSEIKGNLITGGLWGAQIFGDNTNVQINSNCISTIIQGIQITKDGVISDQGNGIFEAGNCFTGSGTNVSNANANNIFKYYVQEDRTAADCEFPNNFMTANYDIADSDFTSPADDCGTNFQIPPPSEGIPSCVKNKSLTELLDQSVVLESEIAQGAVGNELSDAKSCLHLTYSTIYEKYVLGTDYQSAFNYFSQKADFHFKTYALSALMEGELYGQAKSYLQSTQSDVIPEQHYKRAQIILIDYLSNMLEYELSEADHDFLANQVTEAKHYGGILASIFMFITGEDVEHELLDENSGDEFVSRKANADNSFTIYPNPVPGSSFYVSLKEATMNGILMIYDSRGQMVSSFSFSQGLNQEEIDVFNLASGLYFVNILLENEHSYRSRIVIK